MKRLATLLPGVFLLLISGLVTAGVFTSVQSTDVANLSRWAFLFPFAGIGLRTNLRALSNQGWRPLVVGIGGEFAIAVMTLAIVMAAERFLV